jgi:hypothetical protein
LLQQLERDTLHGLIRFDTRAGTGLGWAHLHGKLLAYKANEGCIG